MIFEEWFQSKQGDPYASMWDFAKEAFAVGAASKDAEIAEYKQDAERYRWLRQDERFSVDEKCADGCWEPIHYEQLDEAIDRARGEGK